MSVTPAWLLLCITINPASQSFAGTPTRATNTSELLIEDMRRLQSGSRLPAAPDSKADYEDKLSGGKEAFNDRCRTISEFAQLGDFDEDGLHDLRMSCG
jgi:hypothetical protein